MTKIGILSETRNEGGATSYDVQHFIEMFHDNKHVLQGIVAHSSSLEGRDERRFDNELY